MKTTCIPHLAAALALSATVAGADTVLQNDPAVAGLGTITNGMGTATLFPDACTDFTVEAWIKPSAFQTNDDTYSPVFSVTPSDKAGYSRYIFGLRKNRLSLFRATPTSGDRFPVSTAEIPLEEWTHVAAVHTAAATTLYVNGECDSESSGEFLPPVSEYGHSHITLGGYYSVLSLNGSSYGTARVFQGSLAEVRVWTRERTAEEIAADHARRLRGDEDGLLLYVPMDDAAAGVARERVSGQRLVVPNTMRLAEDATFPALAAPDARLVGDSYLASTRTGDRATGYAAILTDIDLENKADGTGPDFTFETWLRVWEKKANDQWIFSKYSASGGNAGWVALDIRGNTLKPELVVSTASTVRFTLDEEIPVGEWVHLAATREGGSYAIYLDGVLKKTGTCSTTGFSANTAAAPLELLNAGPNQSFGGDVKEMRVWTVARTAEEIAALFDKAATGRETGLAGCWPMDEGNGSAARNKATGADCALDKGMGFSSGTYLSLTDRAQAASTGARLTTSDFTIEAWIRDDSPEIRGGNGRGYIMSQYQGGKDWLSLCWNGVSSLNPGLRIGSSGSGYFASSKAVEKGQWFHLAATREGTAVKVYLNGELVKEGTYTENLGVPSADIVFGDLAASKSGHVGGIREARAWNYARSQEQIRQTMYGGIAHGETGLVGWWPFDDGPAATRFLNRANNNGGAAVPSGARWGRLASPLLSTPAPEGGTETELAANFGGGWFAIARTGVAVDVADFTFEAWVKPRFHPFNQAFLFAQYKEGESGNPSRFLCGLNDSGKFGLFIGGADSAGRAGGWQTTDAAVPLNRWTHLAATREGSTLRLYVDGALAKTVENYTTLSPWSADYPHDLTLGNVDGDYCYWSGDCLRDNISRSFDGAMREARVWSVARSAAEIAENMGRKVHAGEPGLVGCWPLDGADEGGATRLVNQARGNAVGTIVAGWEEVEPLALKDAPGPFVLVVR